MSTTISWTGKLTEGGVGVGVFLKRFKKPDDFFSVGAAAGEGVWIVIGALGAGVGACGEILVRNVKLILKFRKLEGGANKEAKKE